MALLWTLLPALVIAIVVATVGKLSKNSPRLAAHILSLPIITILAFVMSWLQHHDSAVIATLGKETLILVVLGLPLFLPLIFCDRLGIGSLGRDDLRYRFGHNRDGLVASIGTEPVILVAETRRTLCSQTVVARRSGTFPRVLASSTAALSCRSAPPALFFHLRRVLPTSKCKVELRYACHSHGDVRLGRNNSSR